jgi:hypothetical protein
MPFVEEGELVIDINIDGVPVSPVAQRLEQVFEEYLDYRRNKHDSSLDPQYREETILLIATLRNIARELELETEGLKGGLH